MRNILFILSFFAYSGFYVGLAFLFAFNLSELSRFYSIPLRIVLAILMLWVIQKRIQHLFDKDKINLIFLFLLFWGFYMVKVLFTENTISESAISKPWYEFIFYALTFVILPFLTFI